jgi:hypothetical protein
LKFFFSLFLAAAIAICGIDCASAVTIQLDYSYDTNNFFNTQLKKDLMQAAADTIAVRLTDPLTAIVPGGVNTWTEKFYSPADGSVVSIQNPTIPANTLIVYVGGRDFGGGGVLGQGGNGFYSAAFGDAAFVSSLSRGQGVVSGGSANDYGVWGGSLTFNSNPAALLNFSNQPPTNATYDFFSVALHELGHVLGIGTADSWLNQSTTGAFVGPQSKAANGGVNVPLTSDRGHWLSGTMSDGRYAAMGSALFYNTRTGFTSLDFAGLADVGWTVAPLGILGDVNHDGVVNIQDITSVANHWQTPSPFGDANHDYTADIQDLTVIANHWLQTGGGGGSLAVVPEPATMVSLAAGAVIMAGIALRNGRRRS